MSIGKDRPMRYTPILAALAVTTLLAAFASAEMDGRRAGGRGEAGAEANLARAKTQRDAAQRELETVTVRAHHELEDADEFVAAKKELAAAVQASNQAKKTALDTLHGQHAYQAAKKQEEEAQRKLDAAKNTGASEAERTTLSNDLLQRSNEVSKLENDALEKDPAVKAAQAAFQTAHDKVEKIKTENADKIARDPDIAAARKKLEDAQSAVAAWENRAAALGAAKHKKKK
jgi:hypothetical protein